jgi:hypothetical protein
MKPTPILSAISHLGQMLVHLVAGLVDGFQGRAGQFQLAARFKADIGAVALQPDDLVLLEAPGPAEALLQAFQHRLDGPFAIIGQRQIFGLGIAEFLVLGADAPVIARLLARGDIFGKLFAPFNRAAALLGNGHLGTLSRFEGNRWRGGPQVNPALRGACGAVQTTRRDGPSFCAKAPVMRPISTPGRAVKASASWSAPRASTGISRAWPSRVFSRQLSWPFRRISRISVRSRSATLPPSARAAK